MEGITRGLKLKRIHTDSHFSAGLVAICFGLGAPNTSDHSLQKHQNVSKFKITTFY